MANTQANSQTNSQNGADAPLADQVKDQVKQQTQQAVQQGQQYAGQAVNLISTRVKAALTQQKDSLATGITDVAQILKKNGDSLTGQGVGIFAAPYVDMAVQKITEVGTTIQAKDIDEVIQDTENFGRAQPALFLGAATLIGFAAARFLKSSSQTAVAA